MAKSKKWICDTCGKEVTADNGIVEWITLYNNGSYKGKELRIVHGTDECAYNEKVLDTGRKESSSERDLCFFLGADGLMDLLSMVSDDILPKEEVLEIIKRIHISGYEQARLYFDEAISEGVFEPNTKPNYYKQSDIKAVLKFIKKKNKNG